MRKLLTAVVALVGIGIVFVALSQISSPTGPVVESQMQDIADKVASDAVDQYNITLRSGSAMDRCVQAGMVTAAFLQAKNEVQYSQWKEVEHKDCKEAGIDQ
ncbi:MAG TPA: hypothetical protein VHZ25_08740 [Acidobacteriaceae bacterium]|jgi:RNA 3'-terminal phosphate cyclase|nr:hypothetical protein [Acidobacteriaceae bacterium]